MKKENFVTLVMSTIGGLIFALGMCMTLLPEWNAFTPGVVCGAVGAVVLLAMVIVRRKMMNAPAIKINGRTVGIMMLALNMAMSGMTVQMIWQNRGYEYKGYIIYISAMYAFYCFINVVPGVIIAVVGMAIIAAAYPIFKYVTNKQREKIAPEILRLTDEISNEK